MPKTLAELAQTQRTLTDILTGIGQRGANAVRQVSGGVQSVGQHIADNRANALAGLPNEPVTTRSGVPFPSERQYMENLYNAADWADGMPSGFAGATVYHGSPHKFDKFDLSKVGTGEGAQAYGHGLYFAENPKVAQEYANTLGGLIADGKPMDAVRFYNHAVSRFGNRLDDGVSVGRIANDIIDSVVKNAPVDTSKYTPQAMEVYKKLSQGVSQGNRNLYTVDVPDEHIRKMLDWDKPLSQQPDNVKNMAAIALAKDAGVKEGTQAFNDMVAVVRPQIDSAGMTGAQLYKKLAFKDDVAASQMLNRMGIPGIKYLDQGSRDAGKGTYNYVVFDDKLPKIIERE